MKNTAKTLGMAAGMALLILGACEINTVECNKECMDGLWMDSGLNPDSCGIDTNKTCLVSHRFAAPIDSDKAGKDVIIAIHGFTASTYEWREFKAFAEDSATGNGRTLVSLVLLGGHGVSDDAFQGSTWQDWGNPILTEYDSLVSLGYKNISFACASTGCALLMEYLARGELVKAGPAPKWLFLIDPIVLPSDKLLSLVDFVGPILGNSPNPGTDVENRNWYVNRPQEALTELYTLINRVKNQLETGFKLPKGTQAKVYKSKRDRSADPAGALLIYKGMKKSDGSHIETELIDSRLHVMTRLAGRDSASVSHADSTLQLRIFNEMIDKSDPKPKPKP